MPIKKIAFIAGITFDTSGSILSRLLHENFMIIVPVNSSQIAVDPQEWFNKHSEYLYNYALTKLNDKEQAKDLVQETFLAALEKLDQFENRSSERTWLTAILKNKIFRVYRSKSRDIILFFDFTIPQEPIHSAYEKYLFDQYLANDRDPLVIKEFREFLKKCISSLPELWQSVFTRRYLKDETKIKICSELELSHSYYWIICHRIKLNLKANLKNHWE